jgi:hypothetical protein
MDFQSIWQRAKHGAVSEAEISAAESALSSNLPDRHLPTLIVGLKRRSSPALIALLDDLLAHGRVEEERYCALRVLCRYWGLWDRYLPYLATKISPAEFERDPDVSQEALALVGEYLWKHPDKEFWHKLVSTYEAAAAASQEDLMKAAFESLYVGLHGSNEALQRKIKPQQGETPAEVLAAARAKGGLGH